MKKILFYILLCFTCFKGYSQDYGNKADALKLCSALQTNNFSSDIKAENALNRILNVIGASKRFVLQPCTDINNAVATSYKGIRYILYDREFMNSIDKGNDWGNLFILAHEVGHHINGHSVDLVLFATEAVKPISLEQMREQELEADEFAGFVLAKLGGPIAAANRIITNISTTADDTYDTHPNRNRRLEAVKKGYNKEQKPVSLTKSKADIAAEYFYKGYEKLQKGDEKGALEDYTVAITLDPTGPKYYNRGMAKSMLGDHEGAITDYSKAIELNGSDVSAFVNRAKDKIDIKDYAGALNDLNRAIAMDPNENLAYEKRGLAKYLTEDYQGAVLDFTKALALGQQTNVVYLYRGLSQDQVNYAKGETQNFGIVLSDIDTAIKLDPTNSFAFSYRGIIKLRYGLNGGCADLRKGYELGDTAALDYINDYCEE